MHLKNFLKKKLKKKQTLKKNSFFSTIKNIVWKKNVFFSNTKKGQLILHNMTYLKLPLLESNYQSFYFIAPVKLDWKIKYHVPH